MKKYIVALVVITFVSVYVATLAAIDMLVSVDIAEVSTDYRALRPSRQMARMASVPEFVAGLEDGKATLETDDTGQSEGSESILEPSIVYYDVPLSKDLQNHIFELCDLYEVEPVIVIAMIGKESDYNASAVGDSGHAFGLMQVQPRWHEERIESLGVDDLLNPYQNVLVGIDYLAELFDRGNSLEWVLMAYNGGFAHADRHISRGTVSEYVEDVLVTSEELRW